GTASASIVLPPEVRDLSGLQNLSVRRFEEALTPSEEVLRLIRVAHKWAPASLPANPFASTGRMNVQRAITQQLVGLIGGRRWAFLEQRAARELGSMLTSELNIGPGKDPYQRTLARALLREADRLMRLPAEKRI